MRGRRPGIADVGLGICGLLLLVAVAAPLLAPGDPASLPEEAAGRQGPSRQHPLGTDRLGRDVAAQIIHGSRVSLLVGWVSVAISLLLGTAVGLAAGLGPGWLDRLLMLTTDAFLAFPRVVLVLLLVALSEPSLSLVIVVLGTTGWMGIARLVRAEALGLRERSFVQAAAGLGLAPWRVAVRHVLPNLVGTIVVAAGLRIGGAILTESTLSFLGLGVQHPTVSWGGMIYQSRDILGEAWWLMAFPGAAIALTVLGHNLLGDGLRARLEPRGGEGGGRG